jgi:SPP1 family predicted phage head-tail adaptor
VRAGKLRHSVTIKSASASRDEFGGSTDSWSTTEAIYVSIDPLTGRELEVARQVHGEAVCRIGMRYTTNAVITNRIAFGSRTFEIVDVQNPEERNEEILCICKELK